MTHLQRDSLFKSWIVSFHYNRLSNVHLFYEIADLSHLLFFFKGIVHPKKKILSYPPSVTVLSATPPSGLSRSLSPEFNSLPIIPITTHHHLPWLIPVIITATCSHSAPFIWTSLSFVPCEVLSLPWRATLSNLLVISSYSWFFDPSPFPRTLLWTLAACLDPFLGTTLSSAFSLSVSAPLCLLVCFNKISAHGSERLWLCITPSCSSMRFFLILKNVGDSSWHPLTSIVFFSQWVQ